MQEFGDCWIQQNNECRGVEAIDLQRSGCIEEVARNNIADCELVCMHR